MSDCNTLDGSDAADAAAASENVQGGADFRMKADVIFGGQYEYLPHTADVQLHSWGDTLEIAMEHLGVAMFGYMTELEGVDESNDIGPLVVEGHDLHTLIFSYLDEWLVNFHITGMTPKSIAIGSLNRSEGAYSLTTTGRGEKFDLKKHKQGTEVKAITYSNMQVKEVEGKVELWVIIDI